MTNKSDLLKPVTQKQKQDNAYDPTGDDKH